MKIFIKEHWFKLIISIAVLAIGISATYYYLIYLPTLNRLSSVSLALVPQNKSSTNTNAIAISTSTSSSRITNENSSTENIITPSLKKTTAPLVSSAPQQTQEQNIIPENPAGQTQNAPPSPVVATTATPPSQTNTTQTTQASTPSSPYFNTYPMGATSNRSSSTFDRVAEINFSAGTHNSGYNLGPMTLTFSGDAIIPNTLSGVQLFDPSGNAVPIQWASTCPTDGPCAIRFDLSGYTVGVGEAGSFILTMDDLDTNLEPTTPPGGQRSISISIALSSDVFAATNGIDPFMDTPFPVAINSFSYAPND